MEKRNFIKATFVAALAFALVALPTAGTTAEIGRLKLIVPASAGGGWDLTGRTIDKVLRSTGQVRSIQVENIPGAGGTVALPQFLAQKGQGDTMMVTGFTIVSAAITNQAPNSIAEATPLARISGEAHVLVVPANSPFKTLNDFVEALKRDPSKVSVTGGTPGGSDHITLGLLAKTAGIDPLQLNWIAYDGGGQAQTALLGNHVQAGISNWSEFEGQVQAGRLRALAISAEAKLPGIDVPTFKEQGHDVVLYNWRGLFAPPGVSDADRQKLESVIATMVKSEEWKKEMQTRKWVDLYMPASEFGPQVKKEVQAITEIMKTLGFSKG
ncbi:tripartite tricarboxylate transporter substrate binding protein [Rhizobium puerariae]|uniref:Tripartite tricarboxylate transporter substrate binding protein n=1 Tax=Rhizobium puerariae TaxID=1585791 RepID=A0ABV6ARM5_9HYPH